MWISPDNVPQALAFDLFGATSSVKWAAKHFTILAMLICALHAVAIPAADWTSPVGRWRTFDDRTGKVRAIVQIYEKQNEFFGRIESTLTAMPDRRVCLSCRDDRKNQPIIGLIVMRNVKFEDGQYRGGTILDPDTGEIYHCKLKLEDAGARLVVRGYVGIALFGRSQTWQREQSQARGQ